jgi:pseudouridine synthase
VLVRLQKAIADAGVASRRKAERLILAGRVAVNGQVVTQLGTRVDPYADRITVDGRPIPLPQPRMYLALYKPQGYVSTVRDRHAKRTVLELVPGGHRLFPVGRLDMRSEGLMFLTNDGYFAYRVTHPRFQVEKEYHVLVKGVPTPQTLEALARGIPIDGWTTAPARSVIIGREEGNAWLSITIVEGRKRQVRRMLEAVGHPVLRLIRVRIGQVGLGNLKPGQYRHLTPEEVALFMPERSE